MSVSRIEIGGKLGRFTRGIAVAASYDGHGRLESYDRTNIGAQSYTYNGLGDRVRVDKPTGPRHLVYDEWGRVVAEYGDSALDVKAEFIWAEPPAANDNSPFGGGDHVGGYAPLALVVVNGSAQLELVWVHSNHLGVPIVTTNASGQEVSPGTDFLRPGFPGQSQVLSDLYYNRNRDYDPVTGRYIQADPIGLAGDVNPYVYALSDPVNGMDPEGLFALPVVPILVGAGTSILLEYLTNDCVDTYDLIAAGAIGGLGSGVSFRYLYRFGPRSLTRVTGKEWSHAISRKTVDKVFPRSIGGRGRNSPLTNRERFNNYMNSQLNRRGGLNGSWASPIRHYKHDIHRSPKGWREMGDRLPPWLQKVDRVPDWLKASGGSGIGGAAAAGND